MSGDQTGIVTFAFQKLAECAFQKIKRQVSYVIFYKKIMRELDEEVEKLKNTQETLRHRVEEAETNGAKILNGPRDWLKKANEMVAKAEQFRRDNNEAKIGCLSLRSRHKLRRNARKITEEISHIRSEAYFPSVSYRLPPSIFENLPSNEEDFESRIQCFNRIMEILRDPNVSRIGVYGMGGVGKTTMVHQVAKEAKRGRLFDQVVLATVTQNPNVEEIQKEIADNLGITLGGVEGEVGKADRLQKKLEDTTSLVILDDLWDKLDLRRIGIPKTHKGCKILLTSRDVDMLSSKMDTQNNIGVGVLEKEEAWKLFKKKAQLHDESSANPELLALANDICDKCEGLPIAILPIASALKRKDIAEWRDMLQQLQMRTSRDSTGTHAEVEKFIEKSYNWLGKQLQSIFLLCGLMDYYIVIDELFQYCVGLELFPNQNVDGLAEARNELDTWIRQLIDKSLLQDFDSKGKMLKMHDVVRDAAISMASRNEFVYRLRNRKLTRWLGKEHLNVVSKILLYGCEMEVPPELVCPELEFLLLRGQRLISLPDKFFDGMPRLKVLDLMRVCLINLPASGSLRTLRLDECLLDNVATIGALSGLKVLVLSGSSIKILPIEFGNLTQLQLLDLRRLSGLDCIPENIISRLRNLEELYISNSFYRWGDRISYLIKNASLAELMHLSRLTSVKLRIGEQRMFPQDFVFENLRAYNIWIGDAPDWLMDDEEEKEKEKTLQIKLDSRIDLQNGIMQLVLGAVKLNLTEWKSATGVLAEIHPQGFPHLKHLYFSNNHQIQYISSTREPDNVHECFPNLETLTLQDVLNLKKICHGLLSGNSFSKLMKLSVIKSPNMKCLISYNVFKLLHSLKKLHAENCESLVIVFELVGTRGHYCYWAMRFALKELYLAGLPNLRHVWNLDPQGIANFRWLCIVSVSGCPRLDYLFPVSVAKTLSHLERLNMADCGFKSIVAGESSDGLLSFMFPRLTSLSIVRLPNLRYFYPGRYTIEWPRLRQITFGEAYQIRKILGFDLPSYVLRLFSPDCQYDGVVTVNFTL